MCLRRVPSEGVGDVTALVALACWLPSLYGLISLAHAQRRDAIALSRPTQICITSHRHNVRGAACAARLRSRALSAFCLGLTVAALCRLSCHVIVTLRRSRTTRWSLSSVPQTWTWAVLFGCCFLLNFVLVRFPVFRLFSSAALKIMVALTEASNNKRYGQLALAVRLSEIGLNETNSFGP